MRVEWPTLVLICLCYLVWSIGLFLIPPVSVFLAILLLIPAIAMQSSLQHEVLHGHPFPNGPDGAPLVYASLNLAIPYGRFRDTHLAHHQDSRLTDPYDDPESNYMDPGDWEGLPRSLRVVFYVNNTLLGRILLGPALAQFCFMKSDFRAILAGDRTILSAWLGHLVAVSAILWLVALSPLPIWAYLIAAYGGLSILKIRTFLEHQAHEKARARTVIIEDRGPLAFLFLNNNLHVVHHMHPRTPWYRLPALYAGNRDRYLTRNDGYLYKSYAQVFRRHLLSGKDPVPHPLWRRK